MAGSGRFDFAALRLTGLVGLFLLILTVLGWGGYVAFDRYLTERRVAERMGPVEKVVGLPAMEFFVGADRTLDLKVSLVLKRDQSFALTPGTSSRINARLYEAFQDIGIDGLDGVDGAGTLKRTIQNAVEVETGSTAIRDVYIERLLIK